MAVSQGRLQQQHVRIFKTECIGQGSFGIVYKAQCNLLACAAKIIRPDLFDKTDSSREELLEKVASGFALLNQFQHPNIIQCLGTDQDDVLGLPVLLMEFIEENLTSFLQHNPLLSNHLHVQVDIVSDVSLALYYLHSNGIIHGNLSSNNVFVCPSHRAKVSDIKMLDLPVSTTASDGPGSPVSTNSYKPTEAFGDSEVECEKLDCFSVGVVSVQVITGRFPDPSPKLQRVKSYAGKHTVHVCVHVRVHVYSSLARLVVKEEKKENPDPIHHTKTTQTRKHKMTRTPGCPALRTGMVGTCVHVHTCTCTCIHVCVYARYARHVCKRSSCLLCLVLNSASLVASHVYCSPVDKITCLELYNVMHPAHWVTSIFTSRAV